MEVWHCQPGGLTVTGWLVARPGCVGQTVSDTGACCHIIAILTRVHHLTAHLHSTHSHVTVQDGLGGGACEC